MADKPITEMTEAELTEMLSGMDKDAIDTFARAELGIDLDKRKNIETLRSIVLEKIKASRVKAVPEAQAKPKDGVKFLKNKKTGHVFEWTELLAKVDDLIPCDKDGNPV